MPSDHAEVTLDGVRVGDEAILGELDLGLALAQRFVHENRIRQAASSLGAAAFCIDEAVEVGARAHRVGQAAVAQPGRSSSRSLSCGPNASSCAGSCAARLRSSTATTTWR